MERIGPEVAEFIARIFAAGQDIEPDPLDCIGEIHRVFSRREDAAGFRQIEHRAAVHGIGIRRP